jgi:hypothetical protein
MNFREQLHKVKYGPVCNIGGDNPTTTTQSTNNYDNRQVNTTTLDCGAIAGALGLAQQVASGSNSLASQVVDGANAGAVHAYDFAGGLFNTALDFADQSNSRSLNAYDRAGALEVQAVSTLQSAYADAKGTTDSQKQIILGVLAVAIIATYMAFKARG